jgi:hypothetical protein
VTFNPFDWGYQTWRIVFAAAAACTLLIAIPGLFAPRAGARIFAGIDSNRTSTGLVSWLLSFGVLLLAGGYLLIAWDPAAWLWLVGGGAVANGAITLTLLTLHLRERNSNFAAVMALLDGMFTAFFVIYLVGGARSL